MRSAMRRQIASDVPPGGKPVPLVHVKKWDFWWQDYFVYREPVRLPKGTVLRLEASFDNSAANPSNPNRPPKRVTWGEGTDDEMCLCGFEVTCDRVLDLLACPAWRRCRADPAGRWGSANTGQRPAR